MDKELEPKYPQECYNRILNEVISYFQFDKKTFPKTTYIIWRKNIKKLFNKGILVDQIIRAIPIAAKKRDWPIRMPLFERIEKSVELKEEKPKNVLANDGFKPVGNLMDRYKHLKV